MSLIVSREGPAGTSAYRYAYAQREMRRANASGRITATFRLAGPLKASCHSGQLAGEDDHRPGVAFAVGAQGPFQCRFTQRLGAGCTASSQASWACPPSLTANSA